MGLFGKKEKDPVFCVSCGQEIKKKRHKCSDGNICNDCFVKAGYGFPESSLQTTLVTKRTQAKDVAKQVEAGTRFATEPLVSDYLYGLPYIKSCVRPFLFLSLDAEELVVTVGSLSEIKNNGSKTFRIPYGRVLSIDILNNETIATKNKSVVGRGIVGGLLFGPLGAVLGGMSGIGTTNITKRMRIIAVAYIDKQGEIQNIAGELCDAALGTEKVEQQFCDYFNRKYNQNLEQEETNEHGDVLL